MVCSGPRQEIVSTRASKRREEQSEAAERNTHLYLCQINLREHMHITHTILNPFTSAVRIRTFTRRHQPLNIAIIVHFNIHAETPVKGCVWTIDIKVCNSALDDFGDDVSCLLITGDANTWVMSAVEVWLD